MAGVIEFNVSAFIADQKYIMNNYSKAYDQINLFEDYLIEKTVNWDGVAKENYVITSTQLLDDIRMLMGEYIIFLKAINNLTLQLKLTQQKVSEISNKISY